MLKKIFKSNRGSFTVEAALIVSCILFVLAALVYSFMILHQKALLTKAASLIAQQGAEIWVDARKRIDDGAWESRTKTGIRGLYYQLLDDSLLHGKKYKQRLEAAPGSGGSKSLETGSLMDRKFARMQNAVYAQLSKGLLKPSYTDLEIDFSNYIVTRQIKITLVQEVRIPLAGKIKAFFNGKETLRLEGKAVAVVAEPEEYIRNMDFIIEYSYKTSNIARAGDKLDDLKKKLLDGGLK